MKNRLSIINSGRWSPAGDGITAQRVAAGIRSHPAQFVDELKPEQIFVAIVGRNGSYRSKKDVDRILSDLGLDISYQHDVTNTDIKVEFLIWKDEKTHERLFDALTKVVDTVYPLPEEEESDEEVSETKGDSRPF